MKNATMDELVEEDSFLNGNCRIPLFPWGDMPESEYYELKRVENRKSFFTLSRGANLFTQVWLPLDHSKPKAVVCMVHGYGNNTSWTFQNTAMFFTDMGYAAVALDLQGHGKSDGLKGFIPDIDLVADDCLEVFHSILDAEDLKGIPKFLYGESLGGAICVLIHFREPHEWNGAILAAPMCKISKNMTPPQPLRALLYFLAYFFPTWAIVPSKDLVEHSVKHPWKRELARHNPERYSGKPRLGTALELIRVSSLLESRLQDVDLPLLIIHGTADVVTEPAVSMAMFEKAKSDDKTLKLYNGMRHSLLQGETDDNVAILIEDISQWLKKRVEQWHRSDTTP